MQSLRKQQCRRGWKEGGWRWELNWWTRTSPLPPTIPHSLLSCCRHIWRSATLDLSQRLCHFHRFLQPCPWWRLAAGQGGIQLRQFARKKVTIRESGTKSAGVIVLRQEGIFITAYYAGGLCNKNKTHPDIWYSVATIDISLRSALTPLMSRDGSGRIRHPYDLSKFPLTGYFRCSVSRSPSIWKYVGPANDQ